jgi:hypothetical protein
VGAGGDERWGGVKGGDKRRGGDAVLSGETSGVEECGGEKRGDRATAGLEAGGRLGKTMPCCDSADCERRGRGRSEKVLGWEAMEGGAGGKSGARVASGDDGAGGAGTRLRGDGSVGSAGDRGAGDGADEEEDTSSAGVDGDGGGSGTAWATTVVSVAVTGTGSNEGGVARGGEPPGRGDGMAERGVASTREGSSMARSSADAELLAGLSCRENCSSGDDTPGVSRIGVTSPAMARAGDAGAPAVRGRRISKRAAATGTATVLPRAWMRRGRGIGGSVFHTGD